MVMVCYFTQMCIVHDYFWVVCLDDGNVSTKKDQKDIEDMLKRVFKSSGEKSGMLVKSNCCFYSIKY